MSHAYALDYGEGRRITTNPTLVGHIHLNIIIFSKKILWWCEDELNTILMVIVYKFKQFKLLNLTKQQGCVLKIQKQKHGVLSQFNTLIAISLFN
jgi:hypothetical protein